MKKENEGKKILTRRLFMFGGFQTVLFSLLAGRMYYLQVIESEEYSLLADENRINIRLLPPPRGKILDRNGQELASNQRNYRVIIIPEQTKSVDKTLNSLQNIFPLGKYEITKILREVKKRKGFVPVTVAENLTWREFSRVNVNSPDLPGIQSEIGETRFYPFGDAFAHVIGYVGIVDSKEMGDEPLLSLPGFRVGKVGIEKSFEKKLRGRAGISRVEVNAYGRIIREINRKEGDSGDNIKLTLDSNLQAFISKALVNKSASVVVMNVHSGDILSLVSSPSYNPHSFNVGISNYEWQRLISNPKNPLLNKAVGGQYPPGSTFKMMVALAAIENGLISLNHREVCRGSIELGEEKFHCWKSEGHGVVDMLSAIEQSCDVFFYQIAKRVGIDRIAKMSKLFGLGEKTGVLIPSERRGNIPTRNWKKNEFGKSWQLGETLHAGIG
ncbi:MAG: Penicillin-binding protein 2, partial [Alphaproteobacteria bacterium MarineAlpha2_Bin1]